LAIEAGIAHRNYWGRAGAQQGIGNLHNESARKIQRDVNKARPWSLVTHDSELIHPTTASSKFEPDPS
jgi:hypothetical protein